MSDSIDWCGLKKDAKHIGEVSTGRADGSPTGAEIDTSTNEVTGQVRDTLTGKLKKFDAQLVDQDDQFDVAVNNWDTQINSQFIYKNGGLWTDAPAQITDAEKLTYWTVANGDGYAVKGSVTLPIAKPASPVNDDNWFVATSVNLTKMRTDSASQLGLVYTNDWAAGIVIPDGAMTAKLAYWHDGQFYSVGTDTGFTSKDFDADLSAGRFVSAISDTQAQRWRDEGDVRGWNIWGGTDETNKFKNALSEYRGVLYLPPVISAYIINELDVPPRFKGDATNPAKISCTIAGSSIFINQLVGGYNSGVYLENVELSPNAEVGCHAFRSIGDRNTLRYVDGARFINVTTSKEFDVSYSGNFIFCHWIDCKDGLGGNHPTLSHQFIKAIQYGQNNDNYFGRCRIYHCGNGSNGLKPIEMYWGNGNLWEKCNFEFSFGGIAKFEGGSNNIFKGCWLESGNASAIQGATLPSELFDLLAPQVGSGVGAIPTQVLLQECNIAVGSDLEQFSLADGGALFKSTDGAGGGWGMQNCTFWGQRVGKLRLYNGLYPHNRIIWDNVQNAGGVDTTLTFSDFNESALIRGQIKGTYSPELYVFNTGEKGTYTVQNGSYVIDSEQTTVTFDVEWSGLPNTGAYSVAVTLPVEVTSVESDTYINVIRNSGLSQVIDGYEVIGFIAAETKVLLLQVKLANTSNAPSALSPSHATSGRLSGVIIINS